MTGGRLDAILTELRSRGGRVTPARRAIIATLLDRAAHATAEELTTAVRSAHPDIHESTVYRCLEALEEVGIVEHVHFGHGAAVYQLASDDHHHLVCDSCGTVIEVPRGVIDRFTARLEREFDFTARPRHFALPGLCRACR